MTRRAGPPPWTDYPELLTSIRSPWEKLSKVDWSFGRDEDAVFARPCDSEPVMYVALDFCVTAVSLRDWTRKTLTRYVRNKGKALSAGMTGLDDFVASVTDRVP